MSSTAATPTPTLVNVPCSQWSEEDKLKHAQSTAAPTTDTPAIASSSNLRKRILFLIFCLAQFLDIFNNSALFSAIPAIAEALQMSPSEASWLVSAYSITFSSLLLVVSTCH